MITFYGTNDELHFKMDLSPLYIRDQPEHTMDLLTRTYFRPTRLLFSISGKDTLPPVTRLLWHLLETRGYTLTASHRADGWFDYRATLPEDPTP